MERCAEILRLFMGIRDAQNLCKLRAGNQPGIVRFKYSTPDRVQYFNHGQIPIREIPVDDGAQHGPTAFVFGGWEQKACRDHPGHRRLLETNLGAGRLVAVDRFLKL